MCCVWAVVQSPCQRWSSPWASSQCPSQMHPPSVLHQSLDSDCRERYVSKKVWLFKREAIKVSLSFSLCSTSPLLFLSLHLFSPPSLSVSAPPLSLFLIYSLSLLLLLCSSFSSTLYTFVHSHRGYPPWVSEPLLSGHLLQLRTRLLHKHCRHTGVQSPHTHWKFSQRINTKLNRNIMDCDFYQNLADKSMLSSKHFWIKSGHFSSGCWSRIGWIRWFKSWQAWIVPYMYQYTHNTYINTQMT